MDSRKQKDDVFKKFYQSYNQEIYYLKIEGSNLLQKIKQQEIKMNLRRQQRFKPLLRQVNLLTRMILNLIKISAFIDTYKHFQIMKQPLTDYNQNFFNEVVNNYYEDKLKNIVSKMKRINQSRIDNSVDFTINLQEKSYLS